MDRPEALNAVSSQQAREITATSAKVADDPAISVAILSSAVPKAFCVGADLKERNSFSDEDLAANGPSRGPRTTASGTCQCPRSPPSTDMPSEAGASWRWHVT